MLHSLHDGFAQFRANYYMNDMKKSPHELHSLLVQTEKDLKLSGSKKRDVLMIANKEKGKGKAQGNPSIGKPKFKRSKPKTKSGPGETSSSRGKAKSKGSDVECHHCHKTGHWRRNCPKYQEDIKAGRVTPVGMSSSIHMIEINHASLGTWVFDTGCGSHLCNHLQGLKDIRPLAKGDVDLRVGNGAKVAAISIGTYVIKLPSGFELYLNNCYYVPSLSKNIISVSVLDRDGFSFSIKDNSCIFSFNGMIYGKQIP